MEYTSKLEEFEVDAIILGCTHFPFLARAIRDLLPESVALIDPAEMLVRQLICDLELNVPLEQISEPFAELHCTHVGSFYTTGNPSAFAQTAAICLGKNHAAMVSADGVDLLPVEALIATDMATMEPGLPSNVVPIAPLMNPSDSKIVAP